MSFCRAFHYRGMLWLVASTKPSRDIILSVIEGSCDGVIMGVENTERDQRQSSILVNVCLFIVRPFLFFWKKKNSRKQASYFIPLRSIWFAAMSITLMINAMAKAQIRLLRTHVCFSCCVGLAAERWRKKREETISTIWVSLKMTMSRVKWNLLATYCRCPRGTLDCSGGSPQSWWCSQCLSWWGGHGKYRKAASSARPQSVSACHTGQDTKHQEMSDWQRKTLPTPCRSAINTGAAGKLLADVVSSHENIYWTSASKQHMFSMKTDSGMIYLIM